LFSDTLFSEGWASDGWSIWFVLVPLAIASAAGVAGLVLPVRSALSLLVCVVTVSGLAYAAGAAEVAGLLLWVLGAGAGLLLLTTVLLLNLTRDEVGARRFSVRRTVALGALVWTGAASYALVIQDASAPITRELVASGAARAALDGWGVAMALAFLALATATIGALSMARRRA
jgi:NADH:ubiquinone oxidoreductase subunit 6 (subunit J)